MLRKPLLVGGHVGEDGEQDEAELHNKGRHLSASHAQDSLGERRERLPTKPINVEMLSREPMLRLEWR